LNKIADCGEAIEDIAEGKEDSDDVEILSNESSDFLINYVNIIFGFINEFVPVAQAQAAQGDDSLLKNIQALHQGGVAVKALVGDIREGGAEEVEEE
jgi:hypothetical protein